ncbi:unnamed protein product [Thelazia callipaeda]|uniref:BED-type domain-containing protein n=1 Tax=Thelazia callipaeda TaxID=103827 RepID=A0A0N5CRN3_THECL|nr:unnamed protein product [Thelazia callipaeda]
MNTYLFNDIKDELLGKESNVAEATATANTLADISTLIAQQSKNYGTIMEGTEPAEKRSRRGRVAEHPCWELVQRVDEHNCMICRICSKVVKCLNTRNAMQHFSSCHPQISFQFFFQIAVELDQSWQMKLQLKADFNRMSTETSLFHRNMWKRRGRAAEHPSWRYFCRINRKSSNCKLCGVHVAYACSGNLMKHLKSRHLTEFAITQREWEEILKRKKQLCELRLKVNANGSGSEEQSPSNFLSYDYDEDEQNEGLDGGNGLEEEEDGKLLDSLIILLLDVIYLGNIELLEQNNSNSDNGAISNDPQVKLDSFADQALSDQQDTALLDDAKVTDVSETANRILQSIAFSSNPPQITSPSLQPKGSWLNHTSFALKNDAFRRRISFFGYLYLVNGLAEDLASFPLHKSLLCMRQIRKYMDEKLIGLEGSIQNSEVDTNEPEKALDVETLSTANTLVDISAIISQQFNNCTENPDDGIVRNLDHPCWDYMHKSDDPDTMICRICTQGVKSDGTQKVMEHFLTCHPQIAAELEQSWQLKSQLKMPVNRSADDPLPAKESSERRSGHGTEHPCWRYFTRNRKSADCRLCGTHVAYACSGNLMRHLRSRHVSESVITQREWEEIQKRKKQLCELRLMASANACGSEEQAVSNSVIYTYGDEEHDSGMAGVGEEYVVSGNNEHDEQRYRKEGSSSSSGKPSISCFSISKHFSASDIKLNGGGLDSASRNSQSFVNSHNLSLEPSEFYSKCIFQKHQQNSLLLVSSGRFRYSSHGRSTAFHKRISSFIGGLAEELASFPMQKSLICMRKIRKFMDEQLLELDDIGQSFDDDPGI